MLRVLRDVLLAGLAVAAAIGAADARALAISTDARRPPMAVPGAANSKVMAMFLYSNTPNADTITLGDGAGNSIPPAIFCTSAIAGTCSANNPGDTAYLGMTGAHGELPVGIPVPFDTYLDNGQPIYHSGPVQLVLTNTTACGAGVSPCSFATDLAVTSPTTYESGQLLMDWVLPCPSRFYDASASISVQNDAENANICGTTSDVWATYGFPGAPSLSSLVGTTKATFLADQLAANNLYFVAFQDTVDDPTANPNPYTYDDAVIAVWFQQVPEPISIALFGAGIAGLAGLRRVKRS